MKLKRVLEKAFVMALSVSIMIGFAACGDIDAIDDNADMGRNETESKNTEDETGQETGQEIGEEIKENEGEENLQTDSLMEEPKQEDSKEDEEVIASYQYKDIFMSLTLPPEWDYEVKTVKEMKKQDGMRLCAIDFWLKKEPESKLELAYWPDGIGLCGTGVTTEEVTFENGLSAEKNTEIQDHVWMMVIYKLELEKGNFAVDTILDKKFWKKYEKDIMAVIGTASFTKPEEELEDMEKIE